MTIIWFALIAWYLYPKRYGLLDLPPNEFGDFFAGAFAPPAFAWLVLGYFLQSRELALQVKELNEQVKASRDLAASAAASVQHNETLVQPVLRILTLHFEGARANLKISNEADHPAYSVELREGGRNGGVLWSGDSLGSAEDIQVTTTASDLTLLYSDIKGKQHELHFVRDQRAWRRTS